MAGRQGSSFLANIVRNIAATKDGQQKDGHPKDGRVNSNQPKEGLVQILDIPANLLQLDFDAISGLQLPIYDGVYFCHAFFKKSAKADLKLFLQANYPASSIDSAPWRSKPRAKGFEKSKEFSTDCPDEMEEDFVLFCNVKVRCMGKSSSLFCNVKVRSMGKSAVTCPRLYIR